MEHLVRHGIHRLRSRITWLRDHVSSDAGYSTETVIITALLAALGIAAVAVIAAKVMDKAHSLNLG
ncbi:hypothetical protein POF50_032590 [Streptomyces sp. SL13]|uniref:Uncharacterized protein n=1 Tax=Streptantibioticus silvisoli TaxID=2705255 RepID=A0AA90HCC1_9ACTN|nr:hypothetical protein [Streptantibioticus silvisoli]MDI5974029.1 hypothetical protein [Streptantibioticus silvisoli]